MKALVVKRNGIGITEYPDVVNISYNTTTKIYTIVYNNGTTTKTANKDNYMLYIVDT